jgi:hypothetical protein
MRKRSLRLILPTLARLPRRGYIVQEKHLRRFRSLGVRGGTTFAGLVHMGEDGNEIWVEAGLSDAEKRFTVVHELVHARRQRAGEELADEQLEEVIVELETVARVGGRTLMQMPSGLVLALLHDFLTAGRRLDANTRHGLRAVYRRIWKLLDAHRLRPALAALPLAARRRPPGARRAGGRARARG